MDCFCDIHDFEYLLFYFFRRLYPVYIYFSSPSRLISFCEDDDVTIVEEWKKKTRLLNTNCLDLFCLHCLYTSVEYSGLVIRNSFFWRDKRKVKNIIDIDFPDTKNHSHKEYDTDRYTNNIGNTWSAK